MSEREQERYGKVLSGVRTLSAKILTDSEKISSIVIALGKYKNNNVARF